MDYIEKHMEEHPEWYGAYCQNCGHCDYENTKPHCKLTDEIKDPDDTCEEWTSTI